MVSCEQKTARDTLGGKRSLRERRGRVLRAAFRKIVTALALATNHTGARAAYQSVQLAQHQYEQRKLVRVATQVDEDQLPKELLADRHVVARGGRVQHLLSRRRAARHMDAQQ